MAEVSLLRCVCGLVITSPRPAPDELGDFYPPTYYSYVPKPLTLGRRMLGKLRAYKCGYPTKENLVGRTMWRTVAGIAGGMFLFYLPYRGDGKSLLEVGCGTGADLLWAKQLGWQVSGLELNETAVDVAKGRGLDVRCSTFEDATYADDAFDCITMSQVLEHLYSPKLALHKCHRLLRRGGLLLVAVPKFDSWTQHALGNYWHNLQFPIHLYHFDQSVLKRMVEDAGFKVLEVRLNFRLLSLFYALRTMRQFRLLDRVFTRPHGTLSDVMLIVAEKQNG